MSVVIPSIQVQTQHSFASAQNARSLFCAFHELVQIVVGANLSEVKYDVLEKEVVPSKVALIMEVLDDAELGKDTGLKTVPLDMSTVPHNSDLCRKVFEDLFAAPFWIHLHTLTLALFPEQGYSESFLRLSVILLRQISARTALSVITCLARMPELDNMGANLKASLLLTTLYDDFCFPLLSDDSKAKFACLDAEKDVRTRLSESLPVLEKLVPVVQSVVVSYTLFISQYYIFSMNPYDKLFALNSYSIVQELQSLPDKWCNLVGQKRVPHSSAVHGNTHVSTYLHCLYQNPLPTKEREDDIPKPVHMHDTFGTVPALQPNTVNAHIVSCTFQYIQRYPLRERDQCYVLQYRLLQRCPRVVVAIWVLFFASCVSQVKTKISAQQVSSIRPSVPLVIDGEYQGHCALCKQHFHTMDRCPSVQMILLRQVWYDVMHLPPGAALLQSIPAKSLAETMFSLLLEYIQQFRRGVAVTVAQTQPYQVVGSQILCNTTALTAHSFSGTYDRATYAHTDAAQYIDATEDSWPVLRLPLHFLLSTDPAQVVYPAAEYDEDAVFQAQLSFAKLFQHYMKQSVLSTEQVRMHVSVVAPFTNDTRVTGLTAESPANEAMQCLAPIMDTQPASPFECAMGYTQLVYQNLCTGVDIDLFSSAMMQFVLLPFVRAVRQVANDKFGNDFDDDSELGLNLPHTRQVGALARLPIDLLAIMDVAPFSTVMRGGTPNNTKLSALIKSNKQLGLDFAADLLPTLHGLTTIAVEQVLQWTEKYAWSNSSARWFCTAVYQADVTLSKQSRSVEQWGSTLDLIQERISAIFSSTVFYQAKSIHEQHNMTTLLAMALRTRAQSLPDPEVTDTDPQPLGKLAQHPATQFISTGIQQCLSSASQTTRVLGYVVGQQLLVSCDPFGQHDVFGRTRPSTNRYLITPFKREDTDVNTSIPMNKEVSGVANDVQLTEQWLKGLEGTQDKLSFVPKANPKAVFWPSGLQDTVYTVEKQQVVSKRVKPSLSTKSSAKNDQMDVGTPVIPTDEHGSLIPHPISLQDCILQLGSSSGAEILLAQSFVPQLVTNTVISSYLAESMLVSVFQASWSCVHSKHVVVTPEVLKMRSKACITCVMAAPTIVMPVITELLVSHSVSIEDRHTQMDYITTAAVSQSRVLASTTDQKLLHNQVPALTSLNLPRHTHVDVQELGDMFPEHKDLLRAMKMQTSSSTLKSSASRTNTQPNRLSALVYKNFLAPLLFIVDIRPEVVASRGSHRNLLTTDSGLFSRFLLTISVQNEVSGPVPEAHAYFGDVYSLWCRVRDHSNKTVRLAATMMILTLCRDSMPQVLQEHVSEQNSIISYISSALSKEVDEEVQIYMVHVLQLLHAYHTAENNYL